MACESPPEPGLYRHFKGGHYRVLYTAKGAESGALYVVYYPSHEDGRSPRPPMVHIRAVARFNDCVKGVRRFTRVRTADV